MKRLPNVSSNLSCITFEMLLSSTTTDLGSDARISPFVPDRQTCSKALDHLDATQVLLRQLLSHLGDRLHGDDIVGLVSAGDDFGELAGPRRDLDDVGMSKVDEPELFQKLVDGLVRVRRSVGIIGVGVLETLGGAFVDDAG